MLLRYSLGDFEMVPLTHINTGITFAFTFHVLLLLLLLTSRRRIHCKAHGILSYENKYLKFKYSRTFPLSSSVPSKTAKLEMSFWEHAANINILAELLSQLSIGMAKKVTAVWVWPYFVFVVETETTDRLLNVKRCLISRTWHTPVTIT